MRQYQSWQGCRTVLTERGRFLAVRWGFPGVRSWALTSIDVVCMILIVAVQQLIWINTETGHHLGLVPQALSDLAPFPFDPHQ